MNKKIRNIILLLVNITFALSMIFLIVSCNRNNKTEVPNAIPDDLPVIDLWGMYEKDNIGELSFLSQIDSVEYIVLDERYKIQGVLDYLITENHIFVVASHFDGLYMYNRQGTFVRKIGDYSINNMQILLSENKEKNILYQRGSGKMTALSINDGKNHGDAFEYHEMPQVTSFFPLEGNFWFLYHTEKTDIINDLFHKVHIYNSASKEFVCTQELSTTVPPGKKTTSDVFSITQTNDKYLFAIWQSGAPYQTIYEATKDNIDPLFHIKLNFNIQIQGLWRHQNSLYLQVCDIRVGQIALCEYNICEQKVTAIYKREKREEGVKNTIDGGISICAEKYQNVYNGILTDVIGEKRITNHIQKYGISNLPEVFKKQEKDGNPVIAIYYY